MADAVRSRAIDAADADEGLRFCAAILLEDENSCPFPLPNAAVIADYLADRLCVPRDMGAPPAEQIRQLAAALN